MCGCTRITAPDHGASAWAVVSCGVLVAWIFVAGALRWCCTRDSTPPSPKGQQPASRRTGHSVPTSRAPMQKESRPLVLSPFGFCGSRRQWVVNPRTRVSGAPSRGEQPALLQLALLEPETAAGNRPVSTKALWIRDHCRQPAPCLQRILILSSEGNRPSSLEQDLLPETAAGNRPRVFKSSCESKTGTPGDNQSHSEPALPVQ